jgi:hypothetical protein
MCLRCRSRKSAWSSRCGSSTARACALSANRVRTVFSHRELRLDRCDQRFGPRDVDDAREILGKDVQRHFGGPAWQRPEKCKRQGSTPSHPTDLCLLQKSERLGECIASRLALVRVLITMSGAFSLARGTERWTMNTRSFCRTADRRRWAAGSSGVGCRCSRIALARKRPPQFASVGITISRLARCGPRRAARTAGAGGSLARASQPQTSAAQSLPSGQPEGPVHR